MKLRTSSTGGPGGAATDRVVGLVITLAILFVLKHAARDICRRLMDSVDPELVDQVAMVLRSASGIEAVDRESIRWMGDELVAEAEIISDCDLRSSGATRSLKRPTTNSSIESQSWRGRRSTPATACTTDRITMPRRATTSVRTTRLQRGRRVHLRAAPLAWCRRDPVSA
jgi:hypothetical protein